ncbi:MAG: diguanylate cyclase [Methylovulum sp.]|nr:diguanylate cyclase [Methylovulum sp.]MCF7998764.1 diguanylate cyclase [Methylovulum sp.]
MSNEIKIVGSPAAIPDSSDDRVDDITFQPLLEHMLSGVAYCHMLYEGGQPSDFIYLYTNPSFEQLTGLKNVTGKLVSDVIPGIRQSDPGLFEIFGSVAAGGDAVKFETSIEALGMWFSLSVYSPKQGHFVAMFDVITQRKLTEEQLKQSEETYRTLFETTVQGIVYQNTEGRIISANPAAERLLGLTLDQMQGRTSIDPRWGAIHEDGSAFLGETHPIMLAMKTGKPVSGVVMGINNPMFEHPVWIRINAIPVFKKGTDEIDYAYSSFEDITERKKEKEELEKNRQQLLQNEEQLRYVLQGSELGFWDWNIVTNEVQRNERWGEMLGYTYEELKNTTRQWTDFIYPDDRERAWQSIHDVLEGNSPAHKAEYRMLHKDGGIRWILDQANVIQRSANGKPIRMSGTHTDITERKKSEDMNRENSLRLNRILDNLFTYVALLDINGVVQEINKAPLVRGGYRREDIIGQLFYDAPLWNYDDEVRTQLIAAINAAKQGVDSRYDVAVKMGDELVPIDLQIAPVRDSSGQIIGLLPTAVDITKRKKAEETTLAAKKQLELMTATVPGVVYQFMTTPQGRWSFLYVSKGIEDLYEITAEEVYHDHLALTDRILSDDRASYIESVERSTASLSYWEHEHRIMTLNGKIKWVLGKATPQQQADGSVLWSGILTDITERVLLMQELEQLAKTDVLTGLVNRRQFLELAELEITRSRRYNNMLTIMMMDIDYFKTVNDTYGHKAGDLVLQKLATICKDVLREVDIIGRLGGEEFAVLLPETVGMEAMDVAERIRQELENASVDLPDQATTVKFTVSIGIATMTSRQETIDSLLQDADAALYQAKNSGRNKIVS